MDSAFKMSFKKVKFKSNRREMMTTILLFVVVLCLQGWTSFALITDEDETCVDSYSWIAGRNGQTDVYRYTFTETTQHCLDDCKVIDSRQTDTNTEPAEKVYNVNTKFYGLMDSNDDVITCLNVTYEVNRHSASNLKGLIFTLEDLWSGGYEQCFRLNFTTGLDRLSVYDPATQSKDRLFYFDCFCDLKISEDGPNEYILKIRSLPFQSQDCTLIDDQTVILPVRVPVCNDDTRTWTDKYCQMMQEEPWDPSVAFYQTFTDYNTVRLTFEPMPGHYAVKLYEIYIYGSTTLNFYVDGQIINGDALNLTPTEVNGSIVNATSMEYKIDAEPGEIIAVVIIILRGSNEVDRIEDRIEGPSITFQGNPCETDTCGPLGSCIPIGQDYFCECTEGNLNMNNQTCIRNPCNETDLNEFKICGPLGSCIPNGQDFYCHCKEGALNIENRTCIKSKEPKEEHTWIIAVAVVCPAVFVIMAVFVAVRIYRKYLNQNQNQNHLPNVQFFQLPHTPIGPTGDDILFAYPEEDSHFVHVVEKLAVVLGTHGGIRPVLPTQHTLEIGQQGQERWLERTSARAKKILWVCSANMNESSHSNFEKLLTLTKDEREEVKSKHVVCFFSAVSSRKDVPRRLCEFQRYNLLQELESMCLYLKEIEGHTLICNSSMPSISGTSPEKTALKRALKRWQSTGHKETMSLMADSGFVDEPQFVEVEDNDGLMDDAWQILTSMTDDDEHDSGNVDDYQINENNFNRTNYSTDSLGSHSQLSMSY